MPTPHHLLAITQEAEDPATRYRIDLHVPNLLTRGVEVVATPWPPGERERHALLEQVPQFDSVVIQRRLPSRADLVHLRKQAKWLAYDFDDAIVYRDSFRGYPFLLPDRLISFRRMISACDAVTAGNPYLAELASRVRKGCPVTVVPTVIDPGRYRDGDRGPHAVSAGPVVGWIGQHTTLPYLEALRKPLKQLAVRVPTLRLVTISDKHPGMEHPSVEPVCWESESEVRMLSKIQTGLAPLADNRWTRGKCGLRLLQFLAAGIPAVASPVGTQAEIADRGACLSARTDDEWVTSVEALVTDHMLRQELVTIGNALLRERFVAPVWTDHLLTAWCGKELSPKQA